MPWLEMPITTITAWWTKTRHSSKSLGMSPRFAPTSCDEKIQKLPYLNLLTINKTITSTKTLHCAHGSWFPTFFGHHCWVVEYCSRKCPHKKIITKTEVRQNSSKIYPIKHLKCTKPACAVLILLSKLSCTSCSCLSPVGWAPWSTTPIDASSFPGSGIRGTAMFLDIADGHF